MLVSLKEKIRLKKLQKQRMAELLAAASHCPECWRVGGYKRHRAALADAMPHGLKGRKFGARLKPGRIQVHVNEQERAQGCTTCNLSVCREGVPSCNLTRITLAKRERRRNANQSVHDNSNLRGCSVQRDDLRDQP